jgi:hypothetical protein
MKRIIAAVLLALASGVAFADNNDVFADPFWARATVASEEAPQIFGAPERTHYDLVDRYNP